MFLSGAFAQYPPDCVPSSVLRALLISSSTMLLWVNIGNSCSASAIISDGRISCGSMLLHKYALLASMAPVVLLTSWIVRRRASMG